MRGLEKYLNIIINDFIVRRLMRGLERRDLPLPVPLYVRRLMRGLESLAITVC